MKTKLRIVIVLAFLVLNSGWNKKAFSASVCVNSNTNWSASGIAAGDNVTVANGATLTVDVANAQCATLQLGSGALGCTLLSSQGSLNFNVGSKLTVNGVVSIGGALILAGAGNLNMTNGYLACQGFNVVSEGTYTSGGTIELTASNTLPAVAVSAMNVFNNLIINGGTTSLGALTPITINGNLTFTSGSLDLTVANLQVTILGNWINNATAGSFIQRLGKVMFNGNTTVSGTAASVAFYMITINPAKTLTGTSGKTIYVGNTWTNNGSFVHGNGTVNFNGIIVMLGSVTNTTFNNIIISGTLTAGAGAGAIINVIGNWTYNGTFSTNSSTIIFNGTGPQLIDGSSPSVFYDMQVNKASGTLTLNQSIIVNDILTLTNGPVNINKNMITVNNSAVAAITRTSGYLISEDNSTTAGHANNSSYVTWAVNGTSGAHVFPFGTAAGAYLPVTYNLTAGNAGNVTMATYASSASNTPMPIPVTSVADTTNTGADDSPYAVKRFWHIASSGGTASITFTYDDPVDLAGLSGGENGSNGKGLRAQQWNNGTQKWMRFYSPAQTFNAAANTVLIPSFTGALTTNNPWALALQVSPLPVSLLNFKVALSTSKEAHINWQTAQEVNSKQFVVERSKDGVNFSSVSSVNALGYSQTTSNYNIVDEDPLEGISYYRLKQIDNDGKFAYSPIAPLTNASFIEQIKIFPNPAESQTTVVFKSSEAMPVQINIFDETGKMVKQEHLDVMVGFNNYVLDVASLNAGMYQFVLTSKSNNAMKYEGKFFKK